MRVMVHRRILDFLSDHKYLSAGGGFLIVLLVLAGLSVFYTQGSVVGSTPLVFDECPVNQEYDISGCSASTTNWLDDSKINDPTQVFWVKVDDVDYKGELMTPYVPLLYYNGFRTETEDRISDIGIDEVDSSPAVLSGLRKGSTCELTADLAPSDGGNVKYRSPSGEVTWAEYQEDYEDMDSDDVHTSKMMSRATVSAEAIKVTEGDVFCAFNASELIESGLNVDGEFLEYGGDPLDWHHASIAVDFEVDKDGDGVIQDQCPNTPGLKSKNGCPNEEVVVDSIEGPRNITVGKSVNYTVNLVNPDNDDLSISWSNGESGRYAIYRFNSTGERTVTVSVSDGFTSVSESVQVNVRKKSIIESILGFFDGLWSILLYGG